MFFVLGKLSTEFILVNATSNVKDSQDRLNVIISPYGISAADVSVTLQKGDYPFIKKSTFINCNQYHTLTADQLMKGEELNLLLPPANVTLFRRLIPAWLNSPRVTGHMRNTILEQWKALGEDFTVPVR